MAKLAGVRATSELTVIPQFAIGREVYDLIAVQPADRARYRRTVRGRFPSLPADHARSGSRIEDARGPRRHDHAVGENPPADFTVVGIGPAPTLGDVPFGNTLVISSLALDEAWPGPPPNVIAIELDDPGRDLPATVATLTTALPGNITVDVVPGASTTCTS